MAKLIVQEGYQAVREFDVGEDESTIGRSADNDLVLDRPGVSRHHARVYVREDQFFIQDLKSHNGTFVNSRPASDELRLKHLDVLQLGDVVLVFNEEEEEELGARSEEEQQQFDIEFLHDTMQQLQQNVEKVVRGKSETIRNLIIGFLSDGHVLIEDVPGVGKTMLAHALAKSVRADFKRIQFTPDMLPNDITGVNIYQEATQQFSFVPGPIFANIVLADEINRGTPRTQSSLLECMSESAVTVDGTRHVLQKPFFVVATQNPTEFHGTYTLPEAQLDRFLMRLRVGYPEHDVERGILTSQVFTHPINEISAVVRTNDILRCQALVRTVHVSDQVKDYIVTVVESTRRHPALIYGCSPRASLALLRIAQSMAAYRGRDYALPQDVRDMAVPTLSHRLALKLQARADWESPEDVVESIVSELPLEKWEK